MCTFLDKFEFQVFDSVGIEVIGDFSWAVDDIGEFVNLQKLIVLTNRSFYLCGCKVSQIKPVFDLRAFELFFHCRRYYSIITNDSRKFGIISKKWFPPGFHLEKVKRGQKEKTLLILLGLFWFECSFGKWVIMLAYLSIQSLFLSKKKTVKSFFQQ